MKRNIAIVLIATVLVFSLIPISVFAYSGNAETTETVEVSSFLKRKVAEAEEYKANAPTKEEVAAMNPIKDLVPEGKQQQAESSLMDIRIYLWLAGMFFVGGIVFSTFRLQISITNNCAMKLYILVKTNTDIWYPDACLLYFKKVKRKNRAIIFILFALALFFVPLAGFIGFVLGYFFKMLTTAGKTGLNDNNLSDCVSIFTKFAKPGFENDFEAVLIDAVCSIKNNSIYRSI